MADDDGNKPTPDPTILTTEQLLREISNVKDAFENLLRCERELTIERLESVQVQFGLIERQRVEQKKDTKDAVDAALAAAKEAVKEQTAASEKSITKSETATAEQLKQLSVTFSTANAGFTTLLNDIKERVSNLETIRQGGQEHRTDQRAGYMLAIGALGFIVTLLVAGFTIYAATRK